MRWGDFAVLVILCGLLGVGVYMMWLVYSEETMQESFSANPVTFGSEDIGSLVPSGEGGQFYSNMRYRDRIISYRMESTCKLNKWESAEEAFAMIANLTAIDFLNVKENPDIRVFCEEIREASAEKSGYFIAGEGGPTEVINSSVYAVIIGGKIALYKDEVCDEPKIALHEILHALGFDHFNRSRSIMNPITNCNQQIDDYIVKEINRLYSVDSLPDLIVEEVVGFKHGRYIDFNISVVNAGLQTARSASLDVFIDGLKAGHYSLEDLDIGTKKLLTVQNMGASWEVRKVVFVVSLDNGQEEIHSDNNEAEITLTK